MATLMLVSLQPGDLRRARIVWCVKLCGCCLMLVWISVMLRNIPLVSHCVVFSCTLVEQRQGTASWDGNSAFPPDSNIGASDSTVSESNVRNRKPTSQTESVIGLKSESLPLPFRLSGASAYVNLLDDKPPKMLENFKNPCWYEELTTYQPYPKNSTFPKGGQEKFKKNVIAYEKKLSEGQQWRLRCLPYFYIAGFVKSGTTEIFKNIQSHPMVPDATFKEIHWWARYRNHIQDNLHLASPIRDYVDVFDSAALTIENFTINNRNNENPHHPIVIGDGSTTTISSMWGWWINPENQGRKKCRDRPAFTNAHYIRHITPKAKVIITMRNPADRLYSHWTLRQVTSPELFHNDVEKEIQFWNSCMENNTIFTCAWCMPTAESVFLPSIYFPFIKEWLDVFPRNQFLFVKLEEYSYDRAAGLNEIFNFLEMEPIAQDVLLEKSFNVRIGCETCRYPPMWNKTRAMLDKFFFPYNKMIADLLNDDKWLFQ